MTGHTAPRAHIALMSVPLHGHVNPLLGVAAELVARGHRVTFATGHEFGPLVAETGAEPVGHATTFPTRTPTAGTGRDWLPADDDGSLAVDAFRRECATVLPQLADHYADDVPDLVVYDTVTGHGPLLARRWGVPEVAFSPTHAFTDGTTGRGVGAGPGALSGDVPCVVAMPRSLQFMADRVGARCTFVGPVEWRRGAHGDWRPPPDARRVALVSLGTTYNRRADVFRWCVEAFDGLDGAAGRHLVLATGHGTDPAALGTLPAWVEAREWVPQMSVLPYIDVFVTAGGTGSVLEGLAHEVPLVVLPQAVEQFLTARRVVDLGLGRAVPPDHLGPDTIRAAVRAVLGDPAVPGRLAAVRREIEQAGGARAAADVMEAARSRTPRAAAR
ncbi:antibiotic resistance macrolide glycosyltransferase [Streptomyces lincolnensis]|uniref:Antibiotic resistance macrolide glycosyltransferase n=1 Tax=Streptomyces lincolnensis TaxID=1915 RepID=A0A1B1MI37_STRLN|nr:nucleotide disphospho-sugar-binding domain-containing protein [Streptomyces lincolnensis]ANS68062.1 antibiotic resistance macrolide glycosyltransferase [Streptomyces lincolnensis]AXG53732.1 antibiotic resistance macrolide glycosyltransferase [Streptomyces lincolnensis]QMV09712.1 hypothetical protein GJU35_31380 [Streptomyces lincolnensis]